MDKLLLPLSEAVSDLSGLNKLILPPQKSVKLEKAEEMVGLYSFPELASLR